MNKALFANEIPCIAPEFDLARSIAIVNDDIATACMKLPGATFSLIVTSPPYNIGKAYEKQTALDDYLAWQAEVISSLVRLLKDGGNLCWQVGNFVEAGEVFPLDALFYPIFKKCGLQLRNRIVWHFDHGLHASRRFSGRYETLLWFTKGDQYTFNLDPVRVPSKYPGKLHFKGIKRGEPSGNPLGKNPSDFWNFVASEWDRGIWEIPNVKANHCEKTEHPCQFPVELVERCVLALTNEGDWVLDPFAGVGTTAIAAIKHSRKVVGVEKDAAYCDIAKQRITSFLGGTLKIRPLGKPVHRPSGNEKVAQVPIQWRDGGNQQ
ncbi:MAG TPA: site-specific DNA-methyltransferase [Pirellulales bacterium]|jgi:DNA modification methylase|nr:site-specific DNA-methyltransferase [Pirellulales bacterium]